MRMEQLPQFQEGLRLHGGETVDCLPSAATPSVRNVRDDIIDWSAKPR